VGDLKIENGRIRGQTRLETRGEGKLKRNFNIRLDVALGLDENPKPAAKPAAPVKPVVTGTFKGNGKPAKLVYVSVRRGELFAAKPTLVMDRATQHVFPEEDHPIQALLAQASPEPLYVSVQIRRLRRFSRAGVLPLGVYTCTLYGVVRSRSFSLRSGDDE
jgi:hypothetical protein